MTTVTAKQLRENLSDIIDRVESGEEVIVIRHSRPSIRLTPERPAESDYSGDQVGQRLDALLGSLPKNISPTMRDPAKDYKQLRDELYQRGPKYRHYVSQVPSDT